MSSGFSLIFADDDGKILHAMPLAGHVPRVGEKAMISGKPYDVINVLTDTKSLSVIVYLRPARVPQLVIDAVEVTLKSGRRSASCEAGRHDKCEGCLCTCHLG